jgi:flagellar biosynthesis/type III secretory pathway protein FliH
MNKLDYQQGDDMTLTEKFAMDATRRQKAEAFDKMQNEAVLKQAYGVGTQQGIQQGYQAGAGDMFNRLAQEFRAKQQAIALPSQEAQQAPEGLAAAYTTQGITSG